MDTEIDFKTRVKSEAWGEAITLWLDSRRSEATRRAYARSLEDLLTTCAKAPAEITRTDVRRWVGEMEKRGNAPKTVALRLTAASTFYEFVCTDYIVEDRPLHSYNPVAGKSLRPKVENYGKAAWLGPEEARALLRAIHKDSAKGLRDYALFLGYIMLARRNSEWRSARWGDFERRGDEITLRWSGKGKTDQRLRMPLPVWNAVCEYLRAAGKLKTVQPGDYIFTALGRKEQKMPNGVPVKANSPISAHEVGRLLKRYLRVAGLEVKHITPHSLRHTGAMLQRAAGASDQEIMEFLGHSNLAITQVYLHLLEGNQSSHWMKVSELLGLDLEV
jgi:integrase